MNIFDKIYCYMYSFTLRTPSRDDAHQVAIFSMTLVICMHAFGLIILFNVFMNKLFFIELSKNGVTAMTAVFLFIFYYVYHVSGRGERMIKIFGDKKQSIISVILGFVILVWSVSFTIICMELFPNM